MRFLKMLFLLAVAVVAVFLAVANRDWVTVRLAPEGVPLPFPTALDLPLYAVIFAAVFLGVIIGLVLELFREGPMRRERNKVKKDGRVMRKEVDRLTRKAGEEDDELLGVTH